MLKRIISSIPNTITLCNLLCGCIATILTFRLDAEFAGLDAQTWVFIFIGAAALFDFCDGLSARLLKAYSDIGKELDSLSDLVSFGVAPAMLIFNIMAANSCSVLCWAALFIPMMGALRLAIFNVDTTQTTTFRGLPIPANAIFWIGAAAWISKYHYPGDWVMVALIAIVSLCMVARFRMFSLKFKNLTFRDNVLRYAIIMAAVAFVWIYGISGFAWTIVLYILLSLFSKKKGEVADED